MTALRIRTANLAPVRAALVSRPGVVIVLLDRGLSRAERLQALAAVTRGGPHHEAALRVVDVGDRGEAR